MEFKLVLWMEQLPRVMAVGDIVEVVAVRMSADVLKNVSGDRLYEYVIHSDQHSETRILVLTALEFDVYFEDVPVKRV